MSLKVKKVTSRLKIFPNFQNCACCEKDLKDNKHNSIHLGRKYALIYVLGNYLFLEPQSLRSRKTVRFSEQIMSTDKYPSIFSHQIEATVCIFHNRPRSIYQYSNMAPRLSGQNSVFGVVFFVSKSLLGIQRQRKLEKIAILTRKPRSHAGILIYRTWPILKTARVVKKVKGNKHISLHLARKYAGIFALRQYLFLESQKSRKTVHFS